MQAFFGILTGMPSLSQLRIQEKLRPYYLRLYFKFLGTGRPAEFSDAWRFPSFSLDPASLASHMPHECPTPGFLFFPMTNWHTRIQRTQHFAKVLSEMGYPCFVLNPYLGRQFPKPYFVDPTPRFGLLGSRLLELHVRLRDEPLFHGRLLRAAENRRIAGVLSALHSVSGTLVQILSLPTWLDIAVDLRRKFGWPIVYDCHDLLAGFGGIDDEVKNHEPRLFEEADFVIFSSDYLQDLHTKNKSWLKCKSAILRNATEVGHFGKFAKSPRRSVASSPRVGYFGALDEWFDADIIRECAFRRPDVKFQVIGRVENEAVGRLRPLPNVELCGEIAYEHLPDFMADFDVALIPFKKIPLTLATNPIKLYEYFSGGIPVVSTRLPEIEMFGDLVYLADNRLEFADRLEEALTETGQDLRRRRIAIACRETWHARAAELLRLSTDVVSPLRADAHTAE
jgi:glycosyltransferase involved in cell wall biosynthesis